MSDQPLLQCEFAFEIAAEIDKLVVVGPSKLGQRQLIPIVGGAVSGPRLRGTVLPGGADWQLVRADGVVELEARYVVRADDGSLVQVHNCGLGRAAHGGLYVRAAPSFEAPSESAHAWLNRSLFVSSVEVRAPVVHVRVFEVL